MYTSFENYDKYHFPDNNEYEGAIIGNNKKFILVVSHNNNLSDANLNLLQNILNAKDISLNEDTLLLKLSSEKEINLSRLLREHHIKHLLVFGVNPKELGINIQWKLYKFFKISELNILIAHSLTDLANNQSTKRQLWEQLKNWEL